MVEALMRGTANGIKMDPDTGLLFSPAHFTWMDTDHPAGTPRSGYPIEIQALWFAALKWLAEIGTDNGRSYKDVSKQVKQSIVERFRSPSGEYLSDCLHADNGQGAGLAVADDALRPNQLFAVTLGAVDDPKLARSVVNACSELLVPGAVRSLADRAVEYPIAIHHNGQQLNDPNRPYQGRYTGDEDTRRKPAYHNGTAWCWLLPNFCEAWLLTYGPSSRPTVRAWLGSALTEMNRSCLGHIPEIKDGDAPHRSRGCDAQAWSVSELLRVWMMTET
jgi:predicted glycogen debranching enzyme